jgi:predicted small secreted protein
MRKDSVSTGITWRHIVWTVAIWASTAAVCSRLGGCGTIDGLGRDLSRSSDIAQQYLDRWTSYREPRPAPAEPAMPVVDMRFEDER